MLPETELLKLERAFMRALREPVFGDSRNLTPLSERTGDVSEAFHHTAQRYIQPSALLKPVERLELYHRQYWFRLLDSIAEDFPALRRLLGEGLFWKLVEAYLEAIPSRSYTLRHLGNGLADFVAEHPALAGSLPVHSVELARLEYAVCEVFEAGEEPRIEPESLAETSLSLQPHVKLFELSTPMDALWRLAEDQAIPEEWFLAPEADRAFHVAVFRQGYRMRVERMPCEAFRLLCAIQETGALATALEASGLCCNARADLAGQIREWFRLWTARGWFCARQAASFRVTLSEPDGRTWTESDPIRNRTGP